MFSRFQLRSIKGPRVPMWIVPSLAPPSS